MKARILVRVPVDVSLLVEYDKSTTLVDVQTHALERAARVVALKNDEISTTLGTPRVIRIEDAS